MAVAPFSDVRVSRRQVQLRPLPAGIEAENVSTNPVLIDGREELPPGERKLLAAPCRLSFGGDGAYVVALWAAESDSQLRTLARPAPAPGGGLAEAGQPLSLPSLLPAGLPESEAAAVGHWLQAITEVLHSATGGEDFLQRAARRVVDLMEFDQARVLLLDEGRWTCPAEHHRESAAGRLNSAMSQRILDRVRSEGRTVWRDASDRDSGDRSQAGVEAIIGSPIRDRNGAVVGALYCDRVAAGGRFQISPAEALLVETLAYAIAVGLERAAQEKLAADQRIRFEQFFSRELADELARNPALLEGRDAQVTVLVADIRGFSAISERIGAALSLRWIQDTLDVLTAVVVQYGGVIVDYVGDEMLAMFGAPLAQADQARRAAHAALDIQVALGPLSDEWRSRIDAETQVGIGIHTGSAQVGNVGSRKRFKYGPLGHTVNLASRVQGANKHFRSSLLVTQATYAALGPGFVSRRLAAVHVQNIERPVEIYELRLMDDDRGRLLCQLYEKALAEFEAQDFRRAARTLGDYLPNYQDDGPSHILLWRAVNWLVNPGESFDRAWRLPGK
jgi:adenylate cyclase